jgi:hypothetical protein
MDNTEKLLSIFADDPHGLLMSKPKASPAQNEDQRLVASFEEINDFVDIHGAEPQRDMGDMHEMQLHSRLKGLRNNPAKAEALREYDRHGLLSSSEEREVDSIDDILNGDVLGLLDDTEEIFTLKHVPKQTTMPDYIGRRKICEDFDRYEPVFVKVQEDLRRGKRVLYPFKNEQQIREGYFFVLKGVLLYVAEAGKKEKIKGKMNARLRCIFENGTESDMLLRSLSAELYKDGRRVSEYHDTLVDYFPDTVEATDTLDGYIYVLKSLSMDDQIRAMDHVYKIGFSTVDPQERIKNAEQEPTYLMAPVSLVAAYECHDLNPQKLEHLLHRFFGKSCLNIDIYDAEGERHMPREWFAVPLDIIEQAIALVLSEEIVRYKYDHAREEIMLKENNT